MRIRQLFRDRQPVERKTHKVVLLCERDEFDTAFGVVGSYGELGGIDEAVTIRSLDEVFPHPVDRFVVGFAVFKVLRAGLKVEL